MKGEWTRERVEQRLLEAADVLRRLPEQRIQGYFSLWPRILHDFGDLVGQEQQKLRRPPPLPDAIDRMEEILPWLVWLSPEDAKLVWARAEGCPWKGICWRFGIGRATAHRRWEYALSLIAWRLNGRPAPGKRSRQSLVERVRQRDRPRTQVT
jgi:hypothetical protein